MTSDPYQEPLLDAARRVIPMLSSVMEAEEAKALEERLRALLDRAKAGDDVAPELRVALGENRKVKNLRDRHLRAAEAGTAERHNLVPVTGPPRPVKPIIWVCPEGDAEWLQYHAGENVPVCETHGVRLVRKEDV